MLLIRAFFYDWQVPTPGNDNFHYTKFPLPFHMLRKYNQAVILPAWRPALSTARSLITIFYRQTAPPGSDHAISLPPYTHVAPGHAPFADKPVDAGNRDWPLAH